MRQFMFFITLFFLSSMQLAFCEVDSSNLISPQLKVNDEVFHFAIASTLVDVGKRNTNFSDSFAIISPEDYRKKLQTTLTKYKSNKVVMTHLTEYCYLDNYQKVS